MEITDQFRKRCWAKVENSVKVLRASGYDAGHYSKSGLYSEGMCVYPHDNNPDGYIDELHFILNEKVQFSRCEVCVDNVEFHGKPEDLNEFITDTVRKICLTLIVGNDTSYCRFPPRLDGFQIHLVLKTDVSDLEYTHMTNTGKWKKTSVHNPCEC